jgi:wobble nucleotide-excising tRNase
VSSLDSRVLFIVSTLIHQLIRRKGSTGLDKQSLKNDSIEQVLVFTHNLYFYKEIAFNKRPTCTDFWNYKIFKQNNQTIIVGERDKVIRDDYSLLWETVNDIKHSNLSDKTQNITTANIMRRILDSYISFIGLGKDCWASILEDTEDPQYIIKCAFLSTINDESHKTSPYDSVYYHRIMNEEPQILFDVFESIFKTIGVDHYNTMMGIDPEN